MSLERPPTAEECAWCAAPLADGEPLGGRIRCGSCGVATTYPEPTAHELDRAYAGWYRPPSGRFAGPGDAILRRARGRLAKRLATIAPPGPVLDVGAGDGALLDALLSVGREAVGIERESHRPDVRAVDVGDLDGEWAAIVFWHSLEHLRDPASALARAAALLSRRGVVVVAVPNAASLQAQAFGDRWFALDLPRHLTHITASALVERLRGLGLQVERVSHLRGGQGVFGWLHGLVGRLPGQPDLYDAIRRRDARHAPLSPLGRAAALGTAAALLPVAAVLSATEAALRRGGTVYVEARRV